MTEDSDETKMSINACPASTDRNSGTTTNYRINTNKNNNEEKNIPVTDTASSSENLLKKAEDDEKFVPQIRWPDTIVQLFLHIGCLYGLILCIASARFYTTLFGEYPNIKLIMIFSTLQLI